MSLIDDLKTIGVGTLAWTLAIPAVKVAGNGVATGGTGSKILALIVGTGIAAGTTPILSYIMNWKTQYSRVRGIAIALGTAQTIDGLVHLFFPQFYSDNHHVGIMCSANIFFGAGLLGIFSSYQ
jgi:hypothetical protein